MTNPQSMMVPGDYDFEAAALARKRKVLEAMMARQQEAGPAEGKMISGHYVAPSWAQHASTLANAFLDRRAEQGLDAKEKELQTQYSQGLTNEMQQFQNTRGGTTQEVPNQGPMPDGSAIQGMATQQVQAPDRKKAIANALASRLAPIRAIGQADAAAMQKTLDLKDYDPKSKIAAAMAGDDLSQLEPEGKTHVIDGNLVREAGDAVKLLGNFSSSYGPLEQVGTNPKGEPIMGQRGPKGKLAYAPTGGTTVNVDNGGKAGQKFEEEGAKAVIEGLKTGADDARRAAETYDIFSNAATQIGKVKGGTGAEWILQAKKLAQQLGAPIDDSVTATEQVGAALATAVLADAKLLGTGSGFSNADRDFLEKIKLSKGSLDPASLKRAVNLGIASSYNRMQAHEDLLEKAAKVKGANPELLDTFRVEKPPISVSADDFEYNPRTKRFKVKTSQGDGPNPGSPAPKAPEQKSSLSKEEMDELTRLRAKYGRKPG